MATATGNVFFYGVDQAVLTSWATGGRFKMALYTAAPALSVQTYGSGTEVASGNGYTTGGASVPTPTHVVSAASAWGTSWTSSNTYAVNNIVKSSGNASYLYRCVTAGTAAGSAPSQATEGALDTSATGAQFVNCGQSIEVWSSNSVVWTASGGSIAAAYGVIYDSTTSANLLLLTFGSTQTATNGNTFTVAADATYGWFSSLPQ